MIPNYPLIPGPPFLIDHLLGLVFVFHVLFMNFLVAAPLVITWYLWTQPAEGRGWSVWLSKPLPVMFTFAITFGVASLLFVQALFAERFFTANVILGNLWLSVVLILMAAFYLAYVQKALLSKPAGQRVLGGFTGLVIMTLVWTTALIMIANYFITTDRPSWLELLKVPSRFLHNSTFAPRLLHFIVGSFAVTGFWMKWIAAWRERRGADEAQVKSFRRNGIWLAAGATGIQISVGVWFLIWQPSDIWDRLFSGDFASLVWISAVAAGLVMLGFLIVSGLYPERALWRKISNALLVWTLFGMVAGRDLVRQTAFDKNFHVSQLPHATQHLALFNYLVLTVAGVLVLLWLGGLLWRLPKPERSDSDNA